jgi:hypothetical protein
MNNVSDAEAAAVGDDEISRHRIRLGPTCRARLWEWSASVAGVVVTGQAPTKSTAAAAAEKAIDRNAILFPFGPQTNGRLKFLCNLQERELSEIVRFISKSDLERARLIREARAIYESIFPSANRANQPPDPKP